MQHSVFGFFVEQGLLGQADGWADDENAKKISARELAEYVRVQVAHWAARQRLSPQTPQLYGQGKDFVLIAPQQPFNPIKLPDPPPDYPKWLEAGWETRFKWSGEGVHRLMPRTFRELEVLLVQSEQRWLAGEKEESVKGEFDGKFIDLKKQRDALALQKQPARSIAVSRSEEKEKAAAAVLRPLLERILAKTALKPEDLKPLAEKPPDFAAAAHLTLAAALELTDPTPEQLKSFDDLLKSLPPGPRFIEVAALRFLVDLEPKLQERWSDKALAGVRRFVLTAARSSEEAAAIDPRVFPWVRDQLEAADKDHRDGLVMLATGGEDARIQGRGKLIQAIAKFELIIRDARTLELGFARLEEARALLPAMVAPLGRRLPDSNDEKLWSAVVANTVKLQQLLSTISGKVPVDDLTAVAGQLGYDLNRLESIPSNDTERLLRRVGKENGPTADEQLRLLVFPLGTAVLRRTVYNNARDIGQTDGGEGIRHAMSLAPRSALPADRGPRADAPAWRAKLAIDLLRLDGVTNVQQLEELLKKAEGSGNWQELGDALRKAWAVTLPAEFRKFTDGAARERASIALHPLDLSALPEGPGRDPVEPAAENRRKQLVDFWRWLARERYQKAAEELEKTPNRPELAAYGRAFNELRQEFLTRTP